MTKDPGPLIDPSARLVSEAVAELGWKADPKALAERVRQLQRGLPAEDEFGLLMSWLGRSALIHRLDQFQLPPDSRGSYRVPDLLVIFQHDGRDIPTLIEVKTSADRRLSWRPDYYNALRAYAERLRLPLLLAWNWTEFGVWTLCDTSLFEQSETNYHLTFDSALRNSLMSALAGDFSYVFRPGVGLHFKLEKLEKVPSNKAGTVSWHLRIQEAYFTDADGNRLKTLGRGIWWMFIGTGQETETVEHGDYFDYRFLMTEESPMQAAHRLLPLVTMGLGATKAVPWRKLMEDHKFAVDGPTLAAEASRAIDRKIIRYVFQLKPAETPAFLK